MASQGLTSLEDYYRRAVSGPPIEAGEEMKFEALRIASFGQWPQSCNVSALRLARAGFYKSGQNDTDQVSCYSCKINVSKWEPNDDPLAEHRKHSPNCMFLSPENRDESDPRCNVPLPAVHNGMTLKKALASLKGQDPEDDTGEDPQLSANNTTTEGAGDSGNDSEADGRSDEEEPDSGPLVADSPAQSPAQPQPIPAQSIPPLRSGLQALATPLQHQQLQQQRQAMQGQAMQATTVPGSAVHKQTYIHSDGPDVQAIINHVPPTGKISQPNPQPGSTDPRKRPDFEFFDRMRSEKERRNTYYDFPEGAWQKPEVLAASGFFYLGTSDRTQCAFCRGILRNWEPSDDPANEHRRHFPECPFLNGRNVGNIATRAHSHREVVQGLQADSHSVQHLTSQTAHPEVTTGLQRDNPIPNLGIVTQRPKNPDYAIEAKRVATFKHPSWPTHRVQTPAALAKAGFYYAGFADNVKCFFCDGGLRNWEPQDDPWNEHAYWFPRCPYIRQTKGDTFVQEVQQNKALPQRQPEHDPAQAPSASATGTATGILHRIEPKEVKARMDTTMVRMVIEMGYTVATLRKVIEERLRTTGDDYPSAQALVEAVLDMEERLKREGQQQRGQATASAQGSDVQEAAIESDTRVTGEGQVTAADKPEEGTSSPARQSKSKRKRNKNKKKEQSGAVTNKEQMEPETSAASTTVPANGCHLSSEYQSLLQQNEELKEQRICRVCMDSDVNVVFLPCAHLVCCASCAPALRNCPICRKLIKGTVRIYLS